MLVVCAQTRTERLYMCTWERNIAPKDTHRAKLRSKGAKLAAVRGAVGRTATPRPPPKRHNPFLQLTEQRELQVGWCPQACVERTRQARTMDLKS
jgi:hypothetical protein